MSITNEPLAIPTVIDRETAFREMLNAHLDRAYRLAAVILADRSEAEDVTHDAIERAWRNFGGLRSPDRFEAWFHRILVNACRDRMRQRRVTVALPDADGPPLRHGPADADLLDRTAERDALERALATLEADQRLVIGLRYFLDLEIEDIAERLGTPTGTVKSRLHRAIRYLRAEYDAAARPQPETSP